MPCLRNANLVEVLYKLIDRIEVKNLKYDISTPNFGSGDREEIIIGVAFEAKKAGFIHKAKKAGFIHKLWFFQELLLRKPSLLCNNLFD